MPRLMCFALVLPFVVACDSGTEPAKKNQETKKVEAKTEAKAKQTKPAPVPDAKAELTARIDALAVIPAELPKDVAAACDQLGQQLDLINQAKLTGDDLTKWKTGGKEGVLGPAKAMCMKRANIAEAACAAAAMEKGGVEVEPHIGEIMQACGKKASEGKAGG